MSTCSMRSPIRHLSTVCSAALLLGGSVHAASAATGSDPIPEADTSQWQCSECSHSFGLEGGLLFGIGWVSDSLAQFGNYRGLEDDGAFAALGGELLYRDEEAGYLVLRAEDLALESRTLAVDGGRQGSYRISLEFDGIPSARSDESRTVFRDVGSANLRLPSDWVHAGETGNMTRLESSLEPVRIGHDRETLKLGIDVLSQSPWRYSLEMKRTTKEGNRVQGGSFIFQTAELVVPMDYRTTELDARIGFARDSWELEAAYHLSRFDNGQRSLQWENPFLPLFGAERGELAQPPDNRFHQLMLSGSWRMSPRLMLAGQFALGQIRQDQSFLASTVNTGLETSPLPRNDLDGEVRTSNARLQLVSNLTRRLRTRILFHHDERDNDTPVDLFQQVATDVFPTTDLRENSPYSHERNKIKVAADFRAFSWLKLSGSAQWEDLTRTLQEVEETDTGRYVFQARITPLQRLQANLKASRERRRNDIDPALLGPRENPELRRFHFSEKDRESVRLGVNYSFTDSVALGLFAELADEDYSDVEIGLSDARSVGYGMDLSLRFSEHVSGYSFIAVESLEADIFGADNINGAPWHARQEDDFFTAGIGVRFDSLPGQWVRGSVDLNYARADGEIIVDKRGNAPDFPTLETRRYELEAWVERRLRDNLDLQLSYLVGRPTEADFFRDGVAADTIPGLLSLGEGTPGKTVHVVRAMLQYRFQ